MNFKTLFNFQDMAVFAVFPSSMTFLTVVVCYILNFSLNKNVIILRNLINQRFSFNFSKLFFYISLTILFANFAIGLSFYTYYHLAFANGNVRIIEGVVENFVPMPFEEHRFESFVVNGQKFSYSDNIVNYGFNTTSSHGGPIHLGLYVKLTVVDNTILKLEVVQ